MELPTHKNSIYMDDINPSDYSAKLSGAKASKRCLWAIMK
jgi:hypothetical protein